MNIFLIGFMGSGKTTLGKLLSKKLGLTFADLDIEIQNKYCLPVGKLYVSIGKSAFREIEHNMLLELIKINNRVISVGGGVPCFYDNMDVMNREGITVYLKMNSESILQRLLNLPPAAVARRLLIANKSKEELFQFIKTNMEKRESFYNRAQIIVSNDVRDANITVERLVTALQMYDIKN